MTFRHFDEAEVAAVRAQYPNHWIVELVTGAAACLVAIEANKQNFATRVSCWPDRTADMMDGGTLVTPHPRHRAVGA